MKIKNFILVAMFIGFIFTFSIATILDPNIGKKIFDKKTISNEGSKSVIISSIEDNFEENFFLRDKIITTYNYLQVNILGITLFDGFVRDSHNMIQAPADYGKTNYASNATISLNEYCKSLDIPLIYVNPLCKMIDGYSELPYEIQDASNLIADNFLNSILGKVDYLDLRDNIKSYNKDYNELFYKTDHHWTIPATFWAFSQTIDYLDNNQFNGKLDTKKIYRDRSNYSTKIFKNNYLGSQGNKLTAAVSGIDDFYMVIPKFKTDMKLTQILKGKELHERKGSFKDSLIYKELITDGKNKSSLHSYASYLGYGNTEKRIINNLSDNDYKLLVIGDSFSRPFSAFMSLCFRETRNIDTQKDRFTENVQKYIKEYKPNVVIMMFMNDGTKDDERGYNIKFDFNK